MFRLCEIMGFPDPYLLEDVIPIKTLCDWEKYEKQCGYRDDIHWGLLMALTANIHKSKDEPAVKPADFMPYYEEELPDPDELAARIKRRLRERQRR